MEALPLPSFFLRRPLYDPIPEPPVAAGQRQDQQQHHRGRLALWTAALLVLVGGAVLAVSLRGRKAPASVSSSSGAFASGKR